MKVSFIFNFRLYTKSMIDVLYLDKPGNSNLSYSYFTY